MRKITNWLFLALVAMSITTTVTSCKDDDDDNNSGSNTEQRRDDADPMDTEQVEVATRWISALTSTDVLSEDWQQQTYEPNIGQQSEQNALTRLVIVADLEEAKSEFASMAGVDPAKLATTLTVSQNGVGSLTWTPSAQGAENLAVVNVDIRQVPHLQKVVYCTAEQTGSNGLFSKNVTGTAYYRFGDVVVDNDGYYWVCVRPSFEINDKGDSHWVNVFNASASGDNQTIPLRYIESNYNNLTKYKNQTLMLPTKLESDRKQLYNLSNLVWAMLAPDKYTTAAANNKGRGLGDFPFKYNGENFVTMVAKFWSETDDSGYSIWERIFGYKMSDMKKVERMNFFYKGYSWKWGSNITFWDYRSVAYQSQYLDDESFDKITMPYTDGFDVRMLAGDASANKGLGSGNARIAPIGGHTEGKWVVRVVTGDKLCLDGRYDPYNSLSAATDVYRFNQKTGIIAQHKLIEDDQLAAGELFSPKVGCIIACDGRFYETIKQADNHAGALGIVVCVNGANTVESGTTYNGLAVALQRTERCKWATTHTECPLKYVGKLDNMSARLDGLANTKTMLGGCSRNHVHPAAIACDNYQPVMTGEAERQGIVSEWFLPSTGQWILALKGLGLNWSETHGYISSETDKQLLTNIQAMVEKTGMDYENVFHGAFLTSTPIDEQWVNIMGMGASTENDKPARWDISEDFNNLPFVAFKYNGGAQNK